MKTVGAAAAVILAFILLPLLEPAPVPSVIGLENVEVISPGRPALALASAGHGLALADLSWLQVVQRMGTPGFERTKGWTRWLHARSDLTTDLDPRYLTVYDASSVYLSAYGSAADLSDALAAKGARFLPREWKFPFMLGWNDYFIRGRPADAAEHWRQAALLPGAPFYLGSLSGRARRQGTGNIDESLKFLAEMRESVTDARQREMIEERMKLLESEHILQAYDAACTRYHEETGSWPGSAQELFMAGWVAAPPQDLLESPIHLDTSEQRCVARSELISVREEEAMKRVGRFRERMAAEPEEAQEIQR